MIVHAALALLGIGGGFVILALSHRAALRREAIARALRARGPHGAALADSIYGDACPCPRCRRIRTITAAREWNEELTAKMRELTTKANDVRAALDNANTHTRRALDALRATSAQRQAASKAATAPSPVPTPVRKPGAPPPPFVN